MQAPEPTADWLPDRPTVPGYDLEGELGRGGMGVVYRAKHAATGRAVAVKVLRDGPLAGSGQRARFRSEAEAAARVRHPNVVELLEVGEHAGRAFLVMELVPGGNLDQHLGGRSLDARTAAELVHALAGAVAHAHAAQVVHRDLKPANVLLGGDGAGLSTPKVADFGLAKRLDAESTALTRDGAVVGTAGYMAPEQAAGRVRDVGPAADVYALGAILYECLTGRPPFRAETWEETVRQVVHDDPAPPSRSRAHVPPDLEAVCLKCLEKSPDDRYAGAAELADDLGRFLAGDPVAAVPPSGADRLARVAGRDGYRIVAEVGRGPRSVVYHARSGPLRQPVAVKVFPAGAGGRPEWDARLRRAADQWAAVTHPQVVPVHSAGWWDESPYLVTDYVPQGGLAAQLAGRPYPVRRAVELVIRLTEVVGYLHRQGVVHGNLKPANVLVAADGIPRVTDLRPTGGLHHGELPAGGADPAGVGYLAPEAIEDPAADPRFYTDVYGLGLILYELLAGRPAFDGGTAGEVSDRVRSGDPVPPSAANPAVPPALDWVCLRCLRKNPWRRFTRVYDLQARLRDHSGDRGGPGTGTERTP